MAELGSFESIASLVKDVRHEGSNVHVTFSAQGSDDEVSAVVPARLATAPEALQERNESFLLSVVRSANHLIRNLVGYNAAVRAATVAVDSAVDEASEPLDDQAAAADAPLNKDERADAVYRAFQRVMHLFAWNSDEERWVIIHQAHGLSADLQRQLKLAPIETSGDQDLLVRMLLDVASADDDIDSAEYEILLDFIDPASIPNARPGQRGYVSQNDLREARQSPARETLYMLAAAIAMADKRFADAERDRLEYFSRGLGLEDERAQELREAGKMFFIEQFMVRRFAGHGTLDDDARQELIKLAQHLNLDPDQAEYAFERFLSAHGAGSARH